MDPRDIRRFVERPRAEAARMKRLHWASSPSNAGTSLSFGELLYEHALEVDPNFPSANYRHEDWEHHLRLKALLDRAQAAFETR